MGNRRNDEWEDDTQAFTPEQVESVLTQAGVDISGETFIVFQCYCPFHSNRSTPAFSVNQTTGVFYCHNPSCGVSGTLETLLKELLGLNAFQARRMIFKSRTENATPFSDRLQQALTEPKELPAFPQETIDRLHSDFWKYDEAFEYMHDHRGFSKETIDYFGVGYSAKRNMITVPMHDSNGRPVGMIGRSADINDKTFKNTTSLPKSKTLFNIHRAKRYETVYITEASFDGMSVFEATDIPNFVSTLGGSLSAYHVQQLDRFFSTIIILTDNDPVRTEYECARCQRQGHANCQGHQPGRELGQSVVSALRGKKVLWATYSDTEIYPHGHKDANAMLAQPDDLRAVLKNVMSPWEYNQSFSQKLVA